MKKCNITPKYYPPPLEIFFTITSLRIGNVVPKLQSGCESDEKWPRNGDGRVSRSMPTVLCANPMQKAHGTIEKSRSSDIRQSYPFAKNFLSSPKDAPRYPLRHIKKLATSLERFDPLWARSVTFCLVVAPPCVGFRGHGQELTFILESGSNGTIRSPIAPV